VTPHTEVRVAVIAGAFQVLVALVALFGTLATTGDPSPARPFSDTSTTITPAAGLTSTPAAGASCTSVIREYRALIRLDPRLATSLTTAGPDGASPIDVDADARRCGIDRDTLLAMR
jgi:hypothetical protein